jgi:hypothetical protein
MLLVASHRLRFSARISPRRDHNMRLNLSRALIAMFVVGTIGAGSSLACSCVVATGASNCSDVKPIGPSFVGTVIDIENPPGEQPGSDETGLSRYRFRIDENISGFAEKEVDIYSGRGDADCSFHFRLGQSYFVAPVSDDLASPTPSSEEITTGKLMASICSQTQPTTSATALLKELRASTRGGATVVGVLRTGPGPDDYNHRIPNAIVELRSQSAILSAQTDLGGVYRFDGVTAGKYQFSVKVPSEFQVAADKNAVLPSITIADRPCYEKNFFILPTAQTGAP